MSSAPQPASLVCPNNHQLQLMQRSYLCDVCDSTETRYGPSLSCPTCDYDHCPYHSTTTTSSSNSQWCKDPSTGLLVDIAFPSVCCPVRPNTSGGGGGHPLKMATRSFGWICDVCEKSFPAGSISMYCAACDYDECCHHRTGLPSTNCPVATTMSRTNANSTSSKDAAMDAIFGTAPPTTTTTNHISNPILSTGGLGEPLDQNTVQEKVNALMLDIQGSDFTTTDNTTPPPPSSTPHQSTSTTEVRFGKAKDLQDAAVTLAPSVGRWSLRNFRGGASSNWSKPSVYDSPLLHVANDPHSQAVYVKCCDIKASISSFIARATITLTFANDSHRDLEGEVVVPLPEDAVVSGYSLEFNGVMVPASLVEAKKAEKVYDEETKKGNQVATMSKVSAGGNSFKTKIHPLPASGTRRFSITYTQPLDHTHSPDFGTFSFAGLSIAETQANANGGGERRVALSLEAEILSPNPAAPPLLDGNYAEDELELANSDAHPEVYTLRAKSVGLLASPALRVAVPHPAKDAAVVLLSPAPSPQNGVYVYVNDATPSLGGASIGGDGFSLKKPFGGARVAVVWDASLSRVLGGGDMVRELAILESFLTQLADVSSSIGGGVPPTIDLFIVRNDTEVHLGLGIVDAMFLVRRASMDGATNLQSLNSKGFNSSYLINQVDRVLLFSDGQSSFGEGRIAALEKDNDLLPPVFAICTATSFNKSQLENYWCSPTGGALLSGSGASVAPNIIAQQILNGKQLVSISAVQCRKLSDESKVESGNYNPTSSKTITGPRFSVTGRIALPPNTPVEDLALHVTLSLPSSSSTSSPQTLVRVYELKKSSASSSSPLQSNKKRHVDESVVQLLWAQQRIAELEVFPERNGAEILRLGRQFGIVTSSASLLILDTLDQHLTHSIEPHPARKDLLAEYQTKKKSRQQSEAERAEKKVEGPVLTMWNSTMSWYKRNFVAEAKRKACKVEEQDRRRLNEIQRQRCSLASEQSAPLCDSFAVPAPAPAPAAARLSSLNQCYQPASATNSSMSASPACAGFGFGGAGGGPGGASPMAAGALSPSSAPPTTATATVKYWSPDTPYLKEMKAADQTQGQYQEYLRQRNNYIKVPAFYLDVGAFFLNPKDLTEERRLLAIRVLSNIAELGLDNSRVLRVLGYKLYEAKEWALAREVFCKVATFRPSEPQSFRDLGLTFLESGWYQQAVNLLWRTILMEINHSFKEIEIECLWEIKDALARAARANVPIQKPSLLARYYRELNLHENTPLDLRITMAWDQDAVDIDLHVKDPLGEEAYYGHKETAIGGRMSRDFTQGYGPESFVLKTCPPQAKGKYAVKCHYFASHQKSLTGPTTAILTITTNFLRPEQSTQCTLIRLTEQRDNGEIGSVVVQ